MQELGVSPECVRIRVSHSPAQFRYDSERYFGLSDTINERVYVYRKISGGSIYRTLKYDAFNEIICSSGATENQAIVGQMRSHSELHQFRALLSGIILQLLLFQFVSLVRVQNSTEKFYFLRAYYYFIFEQLSDYISFPNFSFPNMFPKNILSFNFRHIYMYEAQRVEERLSQRWENRALKTLDPIPAPNFGTLKDTRTRGINRSTDRAIRIGDTKSRGSPSN